MDEILYDIWVELVLNAHLSDILEVVCVNRLEHLLPLLWHAHAPPWVAFIVWNSTGEAKSTSRNNKIEGNTRSNPCRKEGDARSNPGAESYTYQSTLPQTHSLLQYYQTIPASILTLHYNKDYGTLVYLRTFIQESYWPATQEKHCRSPFNGKLGALVEEGWFMVTPNVLQLYQLSINREILCLTITETQHIAIEMRAIMDYITIYCPFFIGAFDQAEKYKAFQHFTHNHMRLLNPFALVPNQVHSDPPLPEPLPSTLRSKPYDHPIQREKQVQPIQSPSSQMGFLSVIVHPRLPSAVPVWQAVVEVTSSDRS
ncbi:hypothetical protein IW261DRAFT_1423216 [Armillaria novae-zelandiae]|uniref:Uncharacterized protein n=1 Tax=Armillaria novae-zelandiae TaxID=153914 RepID=A0AA39NYA7_9AGAR|nr:hypothetical protein IW261DRAFT_1423216 [Armillaria novae-zelandiae]